MSLEQISYAMAEIAAPFGDLADCRLLIRVPPKGTLSVTASLYPKGIFRSEAIHGHGDTITEALVMLEEQVKAAVEATNVG